MHHIKFKCTCMSVIEEQQILMCAMPPFFFIIVRSQIMFKASDASQSRGFLLSSTIPTLFDNEKLH